MIRRTFLVVNPDTALFKICFILFCCIFSLSFFFVIFLLYASLHSSFICFLYFLCTLHLYYFFTFPSIFFPNFSFWHFSFWTTRPPDPGLLALTHNQEQDHQDMEAIFLLTCCHSHMAVAKLPRCGLPLQDTIRYSSHAPFAKLRFQSTLLAIHLGNSACGLVFPDDTVDFL